MHIFIPSIFISPCRNLLVLLHEEKKNKSHRINRVHPIDFYRFSVKPDCPLCWVVWKYCYFIAVWYASFTKNSVPGSSIQSIEPLDRYVTVETHKHTPLSPAPWGSDRWLSENFSNRTLKIRCLDVMACSVTYRFLPLRNLGKRYYKVLQTVRFSILTKLQDELKPENEANPTELQTFLDCDLHKGELEWPDSFFAGGGVSSGDSDKPRGCQIWHFTISVDFGGKSR